MLPHLSDDDRAKIKSATNKDADQLDVTQPLDNLVAGGFKLKQDIASQGSEELGLRYYNTGTVSGAGSAGYVNNVEQYRRELTAGSKLSSDPYEARGGTGQPGVI